MMQQEGGGDDDDNRQEGWWTMQGKRAENDDGMTRWCQTVTEGRGGGYGVLQLSIVANIKASYFFIEGK